MLFYPLEVVTRQCSRKDAPVVITKHKRMKFFTEPHPFFIIKTNTQMTWFRIFYFYCYSDVVRILRNKRHSTARWNMIQVY